MAGYPYPNSTINLKRNQNYNPTMSNDWTDNQNMQNTEGNNDNFDGVFAQLTDMFGELHSSERILDACKINNWNLDLCVDWMIKETDQSKLWGPPDQIENPFVHSNWNYWEEGEPKDTTDDILIESEEIITNGGEESTEPITSNQSPIRDGTMLGAIKKRPKMAGNRNPPNCVPFGIHPDWSDLVQSINSNIKIMIIMRGLPGSGKSYLAKQLWEATVSNSPKTNHIFSTDDYFLNRNGEYVYNREKLSDAHEWNQNLVRLKVDDGWSPIIIDNTMVRIWEMFAYAEMAVRNGYVIKLVSPNTPWNKSPGQLTKRSKHSVPKETIVRMLRDFEPISVEDFLRNVRVKYSMEIPQIRRFPEPAGEDLIDLFKVSKPKVKNERKNVHVGEDSQLAINPWPGISLWEPRTDWGSNWDDKLPIKSPTKEVTPKPPRDPINNDTICSILRENRTVPNPPSDPPIDSNTDEPQMEAINQLERHAPNCPNENESFSQIRQIYPTIPIQNLWDLFEKCNGNGHWAMDILLKEDKIDEIGLGNSKSNRNLTFTCNCGSESTETIERTEPGLIPFVGIKPKSPNRRQTERNQLVKQQIEQNFRFGDEFYSPHTRSIRDIRHPKPPPISIAEIPLPGETESKRNDTAVRADDEQIVSDNDTVVGEDDEQTASDNEDDEVIEIDLGSQLITQLDCVFGMDTERHTLPLTDMKTKVFMPRSMAQQLYAIWLESLYNQLEEQRIRTIKDDEEFARRLNAEHQTIITEAVSTNQSIPTNLKDIMDMELTWSAYKAKIDEWKQRTPQDWASQMSREKLFQIFPGIDPDTLTELLVAHDNKFGDTVEILNRSLCTVTPNTIQRESETLFQRAHDESEAASKRQVSVPGIETSDPTVSKKLNREDAKRAALRDFEECRNSAMHHNNLKAECYVKAQEAFQRGDSAVAVYYSQIASLHKTKIDHFNHRAANCIMEVHNFSNDDPNMLDLHYLLVTEAIECLDIFLDKHIQMLKATNRPHKRILVITGRGLHSANGYSTIKQKAKARLRERRMRYFEVNPGLLNVKIYQNAAFSQDN